MTPEIELKSLKLADGERILRFSEQKSGLCLEKRLDPKQPVAKQAERWRGVFVNMLKREIDA